MKIPEEEFNELFSTLSKSLEDAHFNLTLGKEARAKEFMSLAEQTLETIQALVADDFSWACKEPHCMWQHNSRTKHA